MGKLGSIWQDATDARLRELCADNSLSFRDMGGIMTAEFNVRIGRNACIGRASRLDIVRPERPSATMRSGPKRVYKPRIKMIHGSVQHYKAEDVAPVKLRAVDVVPLNRKLTDDAFNQIDHCHYPEGEGSEITFCGHPALKGFSYCGPHLNLCTRAAVDISAEEIERRRAYGAKHHPKKPDLRCVEAA